jgi:hypothetical protein
MPTFATFITRLVEQRTEVGPPDPAFEPLLLSAWQMDAHIRL